MQTLLQDLRYGARMLFKNPSFTAAAIIAIALGIGANTAIFSVVNVVLLRPLPYNQPERLVAVWESDSRKAESKRSISYPDFFDWRERNQSLENVAVYRGAAFSMSGAGQPVQLSGQIVSAELFDLLQVKPHIGRSFKREDEKVRGAQSSRAAIISYSLWQRQFAADLKVIGQAITLDRKPFEIVGVMPAGLQFPIQADPVEIWVTSAIDSEPDAENKAITERRGFRLLQGIARLKSEVTIQQAQAEMNAIANALAEEYPDNNFAAGIRLIPFHDDLVSDYRTALLILLGAVGCILLIACANVANLMLARTTTRYKEIAVRAALGASRLRLIRQLLTESVLLSLIGGLLGLLLAWWGLEILLKLIPEDLPRLSEIKLDRWVLGFTFLLSLVTGVLFGVIPAIQGSKTDLNEVMKEGAHGNSGSHRRAWLRSTLVIAEIAIALVLLISASLLGQTFMKLQRVDLGFDSSNILTATVELPATQYPKPEQKIAFYQQLLARVKTLPGVHSASGVMPLPVSGNDATGSFQIEGRLAPQGEEPQTDFCWINLDYFKTMKIAFVAGRDFTASDHLKAPPVVIINETFAKQHFPDENPLGKHLRLPISEDEEGTSVEIVGVVKDVKQRASFSRATDSEMYIPYAQIPFFNQMSLVVRTDTEPRSLAKALQNEVAMLDKELPLYEIKTMHQYIGKAVAQPKFTALLFGIFAGVALVLSAVGIYGVMAYSVTQRTHEIGIRLALGAQTGEVLKMVVGQGMRLIITGIGIGVLASIFLTRLMSSLLFGISATDLLTFAAVAALLTGVAMVACLVPARRAAKVDPMVALRYE